MKVNELIDNNNVVVYGFKAFKDLENKSNKRGEKVIISTLSPAIMADMGITNYFTPILPRNKVFNVAEDVLAANLDVQMVTVYQAPSWNFVKEDNIIIVTRHQGSLNILKSMYPNATVLSGNVTEEDIKGMHVIGTLPPNLIQYCKSYRAASIKDFDYTKDGDLTGQELINRLIICNPISISISK